MPAKAFGHRVARAAGSSAPGRWFLNWYRNQGLVGETAEDVAALRQQLATLQDLWDRHLPEIGPPSLDELTEDLRDNTVPPLDRPAADIRADLTDDQRHWLEHGYVIKKSFVPDELLDAYWSRRMELDQPHGWESTAPYMHVPEVLALGAFKPLNDLLDGLIGEPMGLSLNLTGIVSTERNWHQDDYLNPPQVKGWYAAAWFAVDDIDPDSGPFQFIPGSHRWPVLRQERVRQFLSPEERNSPQWPRHTERFLDDLIEARVKERGEPIETFLGKKGDVLVWHSRLFHRGSLPRVPGAIRASFISHYVGVNHWAGPEGVATTPDGGRYMLVDVPLT